MSIPVGSGFVEIAMASADRYIAALHSQVARGNLTLGMQRVIEKLVASLENAKQRRSRLAADEVPFTKSSLEHVPLGERKALLNQFALGFGNPEAPYLVMGTEHAYNLSAFTSPEEESWALEGFALENCASAIMWLSEGDDALAAHIMSNESYGGRGLRPYHQHPWDYADKVASMHTWRVVARALDVAPFQALSERAYQIERSASPSRRSRGGAAPTPERVAFLRDFIDQPQPTTTVLVLHGKSVGNVPTDWAEVNDKLARAFLRVKELPPEMEPPLLQHLRPLRWWRVGHRSVLYTNALNGRTTDSEYCRAVASIVKGI